MKCIKSIKATKSTAVGTYIRTTELDAEGKVKSGFWTYAPKSEYKAWRRGGKVEEPQLEEETTKQTKNKKKK